MQMKKLGIAILTIGLMFGLAACGTAGKTQGEKTEAVKNVKLVSQDFEEKGAVCWIAITDRGIYKSNLLKNNELHYFDFDMKTEIYLCNKPECKHDGNPYCIATTKQYDYKIVQWYSDQLLIAATEETETQYLFHILAVTADGSALNNLVTVAKVEKAGIASVEVTGFVVHRNRAVFGISLTGTEGLKDSVSYTSFIVNLDTRESVCLDEKVIDRENAKVSSSRGYGDSLFYQKESKNIRELYRYIIEEEREEICELPQFWTQYTVRGNTVIYGTRSSGFGLYQLDTKENRKIELSLEDAKNLVYEHEKPVVLFHEQAGVATSGQIETDENYIYVLLGYTGYRYPEDDSCDVAVPIQIYDLTGEYIKSFDAGPAFHSLEKGMWNLLTASKGRPVRIAYEIIDGYYYCILQEPQGEKTQIYRCKLQDLIAGIAELELIWDGLFELTI